MKNISKLAIFVFSYNRGRHLKACINSIIKCVPECFVYVLDDNSDDFETLEVLNTLPENIAILRAETNDNIKHGGLYNNMNMALDICPDCDIVIYIQDDMQFVRSFEKIEILEWKEIIHSSEKPVFLYPCFLKQTTCGDLDLDLHVTKEYYTSRNENIITGRFYSDIFIASPEILKKIHWKFENGEFETSSRAASKFSEMRYLTNPIIAYTPRPRSFRKKRRNLPITIIEAIFRFGQYEFEIMHGDSLKKFLFRNPSILPIAEFFLKVKDTQFKTPWMYSVFDASVLVYPIYNFSQSPIAYFKHQIKKRFIKKNIYN